MTEVVKTMFEDEQKMKEETWESFTPQQRLGIVDGISNMTRNPESIILTQG
jgi:hypothetical protein